MLLGALLASIPHVFAGISVDASMAELPIDGITDDSREVQPGFLFVAVPGVNVDGHRFIPNALAAGATVVAQA